MRIAGARRILEIGTLGGYSTICLARAAGPESSVVTLEYEPRHAEVAAANLRRAGVGDRVEIIVGAALDTLPTLTGRFDFVFIDADKENNSAYVQWAIELGRPGTVIVVDNIVRDGRILDPAADDHQARAVRDRLGGDERRQAEPEAAHRGVGQAAEGAAHLERRAADLEDVADRDAELVEHQRMRPARPSTPSRSERGSRTAVSPAGSCGLPTCAEQRIGRRRPRSGRRRRRARPTSARTLVSMTLRHLAEAPRSAPAPLASRARSARDSSTSPPISTAASSLDRLRGCWRRPS